MIAARNASCQRQNLHFCVPILKVRVNGHAKKKAAFSMPETAAALRAARRQNSDESRLCLHALIAMSAVLLRRIIYILFDIPPPPRQLTRHARALKRVVAEASDKL